MDAVTILHKKEQLRDVTALLECDGYAILTKEMARLEKAGTEAACDVKLAQAERDAGAGAKTTAEQLLDFLPQLRRSLEKTIGSNKRSRE